MRTLLPPPRAFFDPSSGAPAFGSYAGPLPAVDLDAPAASTLASRAGRVLRRKKWVWLSFATGELWLSLAIVRTGYAASAFAFVFDLPERRMLVDRTLVLPAFAADVASDVHAEGAVARLAAGRASASVVRRGPTLAVVARLLDLEIDAVIDETSAPPPIAAIADLSRASGARGLVSATEKRALAPVRGSLVAAGRRLSLDGGLAGYDYTHGLMPRHTRWRWAFAMGRSSRGEPIAFNVVEGFVGEAECAAFTRGEVLPLPEARLSFDAAEPTKPWRLVGDGLDLTFEVGAIHAQRTNLGLVRTRFLQPVGTFRGTLRVGGEPVALEDVPGVVEDQDVVW